MSDRSSMDKPAMLIAALLGLLVLGVALPFTIAAFPETPKSYDAFWGNRTADEKMLVVASDTGSYTATVSSSDFQPSALSVETTACADTFDSARFQQHAATMTYKLTGPAGTPGLPKTGTFSCTDLASNKFTIPLATHSDIAGALALNVSTATKIVWLDAVTDNVTVPLSYILEITPARTASQLPTLPVTPATSLAATVKLTLLEWNPVLRVHESEVLVR